MRSLDEPGENFAKQWNICETLSSLVATAIRMLASGRPQAEGQQSTPVQPTFSDHWQDWAVLALSQICQGHQCSVAALHRIPDHPQLTSPPNPLMMQSRINNLLQICSFEVLLVLRSTWSHAYRSALRAEAQP